LPIRPRGNDRRRCGRGCHDIRNSRRARDRFSSIAADKRASHGAGDAADSPRCAACATGGGAEGRTTDRADGRAFFSIRAGRERHDEGKSQNQFFHNLS
jgi:hypothetical protein